jgi:hypothetical protein
VGRVARPLGRIGRFPVMEVVDMERDESVDGSVRMPPALADPVPMASVLVVPIDWAGFTAGRPADANSARMGSILLNTHRYALTTWYTAKGFDTAAQQAATYLDLGGILEENIRPVASEGLALAVSIKTGLYNPNVTGVDSYGAITKAAKLIRSVAAAHKVNRTGGWGDQWQSALWAAYAGLAGWLMWDSAYFTAADQQNIRQFVEYEANRFIGFRPPYYRDRAGNILIAGDSKAEENAWNAMLLQAATAMMPNHANYDAWNYKAIELMMSAFARPADTTRTALVNGRSVADWLYGSNINDDGIVINHSILHPDYMVTISENNFAGLTNSLARRPTPAAAFHNCDLVYGALVDHNFVAGSSYPPGGTIDPPGGTIYRDGSADLYYPQGNDWGTGRRMHVALTDVQAQAFGFETRASQRGGVWEPLHAQRVLDMQKLNADRRTYASAGQDTYAGREEWVAAHAAQAYLTKWIVHQHVFTRTDAAVPIVVDNLDREFSLPGGTWVLSTPPDRLGPNNRYSAAGDGSARARFTPRISTAGSYRVSAWWTAHPSHATNAPYTITHAGGAATVRVDQEVNGGTWNVLGTFPSAAGTGGYVQLSNDADGYVVADAVKFEPVPG